MNKETSMLNLSKTTCQHEQSYSIGFIPMNARSWTVEGTGGI